MNQKTYIKLEFRDVVERLQQNAITAEDVTVLGWNLQQFITDGRIGVCELNSILEDFRALGLHNDLSRGMLIHSFGDMEIQPAAPSRQDGQPFYAAFKPSEMRP